MKASLVAHIALACPLREGTGEHRITVSDDVATGSMTRPDVTALVGTKEFDFTDATS